MKVTVEQVRDNLAKLTIEVSPEEFGAALDKAFEKVVKEVKIDGFRPGKCPKSMFIKRFGYEALYEEGVNFALNDTYPAAVEENKLYVVNQPTIDVDFATLSKENGFTYTATVDVVPAFVLGEYKGLEIKKAKETASAKEVKEQIERTLKSKAENVVKEDAAALGDTVVIDFEGFIDDQPFEGGAGQNYPLELGSNSFIPGFEDQLLGTKAEDQVDVKVTFPKDYHAELAGKAAVFKVTVHEVKTKVVPELTDEFVAELELDGVVTVADYKKHVQEELNERAKTASDEKFTNDLVEKVCKNTKFNVPECMIDEYVKDMKARSEAQAKQYNIPFELYLQYMGYTLETFEKQAKEVGEKRVKADLVLSKIAEVEEIKVTPEELEAELKKIAEENGLTVKDVAKRVNINQLAFSLEQSKVIDLLKSTAVAPAKKAKKEETAE